MSHAGSTRRQFLGRTLGLAAAGAAVENTAAAAETAGTGKTPAPADLASVPVRRPFVYAPPKKKPPKRRALGANDRIRCGFIGVGSRGSSLLESTLKLDGVDVVAVCDTYQVWRDRARTWCQEKVEKVGAYERFEKMLDKEPLDAVVIATPDHIHPAAIFAALDHGLDVYTEKPMTLSWQVAQQIRQRVRDTGAVLQVGTQLRSMPMYQRARALYQSGELGELVLVQVNRHSKSNRLQEMQTPVEASEKNVRWDLFLAHTAEYGFDPLRYFHWRQFIEYSNGYFGDLMLHHLDICHFLTGTGMPARIKGTGGIYHFDDGRSCPDTVSALVEYPDTGFHFNYTTTACNGHYGLVERYLFSNGTLEMRDMTEMSIYRGESEEVVPSEGIKNGPHLENFFACMRSRATPIAPVEAGVMGAACTELAMASMLTGDAVAWEQDSATAHWAAARQS